MKNKNNIKKLYISQLEFNQQSNIKNQLIDFYKEELELNNEDLEIELELAMNSRLVDLEDTIDIKKVIHQL